MGQSYFCIELCLKPALHFHVNTSKELESNIHKVTLMTPILQYSLPQWRCHYPVSSSDQKPLISPSPFLHKCSPLLSLVVLLSCISWIYPLPPISTANIVVQAITIFTETITISLLTSFSTSTFILLQSIFHIVVCFYFENLPILSAFCLKSHWIFRKKNLQIPTGPMRPCIFWLSLIFVGLSHPFALYPPATLACFQFLDFLSFFLPQGICKCCSLFLELSSLLL